MYDVTELAPKLRSKIAVEEGGCWLWTAARAQQGYGVIRIAGRLCYGHRVTYEHFKGRIPEGHEIDHLCRVRACVNPDHLEAVPHVVNVRRGGLVLFKGSRTHCPEGHPYEETGFIDSAGYQRCVTCRRKSAREWKRRQSAKQRSS